MKEITQLAAELGRRLQVLNAHVTTAESCTGGGIAEAITRIPGSSAWFEAGYVTYSNRQKTRQLGVPEKLFAKVGAVSRKWSRRWSAARRKKAWRRFAVAVSGVAGPDGGSPDKPVGTVWLAFGVGEEVTAELAHFSGNRDEVRRQTVKAALEGLVATSCSRNRKSGVGDPGSLWNNTVYLYRCWPSGLIDYVRTLMDDNKKKALAAALGQIERQFGKGAVMRMGDHDRQAIPAISTGSLGLDIALGIGGLPKGRIVEIYGPESSGKTTLTLSVIAQAQKRARPARSSTPSTPWTLSTPANWASTSTTCWFPSRTPASRPWKSPTCWCAPTPST